MKKITMIVAVLLVSTAFCAADNKISMVTYFPTPYMAYQDVTVAGPCDIGLKGQCKLDVAKDLQAGSVEVLPGKTLTLKGNNVTADKLISGEGSNARGSLVFNAGLTVSDSLEGKKVQSLEADMGLLTGLKLGTKAFPKCNATGTEISWKKLKINGEEGVYLVCGNGTGTETKGEDPQCQPTGDPVTIVCTAARYSPSQGKMVYVHNTSQSQVWDQNNCRYEWTDGPCCNSRNTANPFNCRLSSKTEWMDLGVAERGSCSSLELSANSVVDRPVAGEGCSSPNNDTYVHTDFNCFAPNPNGGCIRCTTRMWYCSQHAID